MIGWHCLFGLTLTDFFTDSAYRVELEKTLSFKQQFIDVIIIESETGPSLPELPDGLENLSRHNLLTYKSLHEPLDTWALDELLGHYVNYRKQASSTTKLFLPSEDFQLYAVSTRAPEKLARDFALISRAPGVYEVQWGGKLVRIIVTSQVSATEHNALWRLFSGIMERVTTRGCALSLASFRQQRHHQSTVSTLSNRGYEYAIHLGWLLSRGHARTFRLGEQRRAVGKTFG